MKRNKWKIFGLIWMAAGLGFFFWIWKSFQAREVPASVLQSNAAIRVAVTADTISFTPLSGYGKVLVFFPGALVDPLAYAPLCRKIAEGGCKSIIVKMPFRLAAYGYNKPKELGLFTDRSKQYILAGHSQGGKMAARFALENPGLIHKLVLLGTTHPRDFDLSHSALPILKIYGSNDGVADTEGIRRNRRRLPTTAKFVEIRGGNHSQFGYYGFQPGDHKAAISRERQQQILADSLLAFIRQ